MNVQASKEIREYLEAVVYQLGNDYDLLQDKGVELEDLAATLDALSFAKDKLESHISKVEEYNKSIVSQRLGDSNAQKKR